MRVLIWVGIAIALVNSAPAQVRLPGAQLPVLPTQKLTQAIGQTGTDTLDQLSDLRHLQIARLIREDRSVYNLVQELTARVKQVR